MTLVEALAAIKRRALSCVEVLEHCLWQCDRLQDRLNAFITLDHGSALEQARRADVDIEREAPLGLLHGIPLACKDMFDRPDHLCTFGARVQQTIPPAKPAAAIEKFESAGAIIVGALNMSEFALGPTGHNTTFGHCRNPWDSERVSGGSSSGAGAAVAADMVYGALGSDTGGSIRIPAAFCGVVGLKPTQGRVSAQGAMPLARSLDCVGPIARTVEDCELLYRVLTSSEAAPVSAPAIPSAPPRLAYPEGSLLHELDPEVHSTLEAAAEVFRRCGARMSRRPLPNIAHLHQLADVIQASEAAAAHYQTLRTHRQEYSRHVRRRIDPGFLVAAPAYVQALAQRSGHLRQFVEETLADADALLLPTVEFPCPTIAEADEILSERSLNLVRRMTRWTRWLNYLGVPALSLPCGFDRHGMPIGMQLVGRPFDEERLFAIGRIFQANTRCADTRPPDVVSLRPPLWDGPAASTVR